VDAKAHNIQQARLTGGHISILNISAKTILSSLMFVHMASFNNLIFELLQCEQQLTLEICYPKSWRIGCKYDLQKNKLLRKVYHA
jgi:hypothetical protein